MNNWSTKDNLTDLASNLPSSDSGSSNENLSDNQVVGTGGEIITLGLKQRRIALVALGQIFLNYIRVITAWYLSYKIK